MRFAKPVSLFLATVATLAITAGAAFSQVENVQGYHGHYVIDMATGNVLRSPVPNEISLGTDVYNNIASPALFAVSSTDLASVWGDELFTTSIGTLEENNFTVYNSGSSAGPLLTATVVVQFFNFVTSANLGGYSTNINFGTGLPAGFFSTVSVVNLSSLAINLNVTDIVVTQTVTARTGTANRLGVVSLSPPTVGTSPTSMFVSSSTIGGGVPGFYTFQNGPADPGYRVAVNPPVTPTRGTSWGRVKSLYR